jgi:hypothetical protein
MHKLDPYDQVWLVVIRTVVLGLNSYTNEQGPPRIVVLVE